jgi:hypothetical protein
MFYKEHIDTNGVIRIHKSKKNRQHNGQKKKGQKKKEQKDKQRSTKQYT